MAFDLDSFLSSTEGYVEGVQSPNLGIGGQDSASFDADKFLYNTNSYQAPSSKQSDVTSIPAWYHMKKGYRELATAQQVERSIVTYTPGVAEAISNVLPGISKEGQFGEGIWKNPKTGEVEPIINEEWYKRSNAQRRALYDIRLQEIAYAQAKELGIEHLVDAYGMPKGATAKDWAFWKAWISMGMGAMLDPTLVIGPAARVGLKGVMAWGAGIGAADISLYNAAVHGEFRGAETAGVAAGGGILSGAAYGLMQGGRKALQYLWGKKGPNTNALLQDKLDQNQPVTKRELTNAINKDRVDMDEELVDDALAEFDGVSKVVNDVDNPEPDIPKGGVEGEEITARLAALRLSDEDSIFELLERSSKQKAEAQVGGTAIQMGKETLRLSQLDKVSQRAIAHAAARKAMSDMIDWEAVDADMVEGVEWAIEQSAKNARARSSEIFITKYGTDDPKLIKAIKAIATVRTKEAMQRWSRPVGKGGDRPVVIEQNKVNLYFINKARKEQRAKEKQVEELFGRKETVDRFLQESEYEWAWRDAQKLAHIAAKGKAAGPPQDAYSIIAKTQGETLADEVLLKEATEAQEFFDGLKKSPEVQEGLKSLSASPGSRHPQQQGAIDTRLAMGLGGAAAGGLYGYGASGGDVTTAAAWAILGGTAGAGVTSMLLNRIQHVPTTTPWRTRAALAFMNGNLYNAPTQVIRKLGYPGERMAHLWTRAQAEIDRATTRMEGKARMASTSMDIPHDANGWKNIIASLAKDSGRARLTKAEAVVRREVDRLFRITLFQQKRYGLITPQEYAARKVDRQINGFWPMVINQGFVYTKDGKERWLRYFSGELENNQGLPVRFLRSDLAHTIDALVPDTMYRKTLKEGFIDDPQRLDAKGNPMVHLPKDAALLLHEKLSQSPFNIAHSGKDSNVGVRRILEEFRLEDPTTVLRDYFNTTQRRIIAARTFGPKNETLYGTKGLLTQIGRDYGSTAKDLAEQTHFTILRDAYRSRIIKAATNMHGGALQKLTRIGTAYETLKLSTAAINNASQVFMNVPIFLGSIRGYKTLQPQHNPYWALFKGARMLAKEGIDSTLTRTGAAYENAMLEHVGEANRLAHSIFGKKYTGIASPFDYIQNPSRYLRLVQFLRVEEFNRALAAHVGMDLSKTLWMENLAMKHKLARLGNRQGSGAYKALLKKQKKHHRIMKDLGLDPNRPWNTLDEVPVSEFEIGGAQLSNIINYRNTPDRVPLWAQRPEVGLLRQFKTFALHQSAFLWNHVVKPATTGNVLPLAFLLFGVATVGHLTYATKEGLYDNVATLRNMAMKKTTGKQTRGYKRELKSVKRDKWVPEDPEIFENIPRAFIKMAEDLVLADDDRMSATMALLRWSSVVGGAGFYGDMLNGVIDEGPLGAAKFIAGPAINDVTKAINWIWNASREVLNEDHPEIEIPKKIGEGVYRAGRNTFGGLSRRALPEPEAGGEYIDKLFRNIKRSWTRYRNQQ